MSDALDKENRVQAELEQRLLDQNALKAELTTARVKMARKESASAVLQRVEFAACPLCGTTVEQAPQDSPQRCPLCKSDPSLRPPAAEAEHTEEVKRDIEGRIEELDESLERARRALKKQVERVERLRAEKTALDQRLVAELRDYDSAFVVEVRELDRQVATLKEHLTAWID